MHKPSHATMQVIVQIVVTGTLYMIIGIVSTSGMGGGLRAITTQVLGCLLFLYGLTLGKDYGHRSAMVAGAALGQALFAALQSRCKDKEEAAALYHEYIAKIDLDAIRDQLQ